jgi:hypothetical protein
MLPSSVDSAGAPRTRVHPDDTAGVARTAFERDVARRVLADERFREVVERFFGFFGCASARAESADTGDAAAGAGGRNDTAATTAAARVRDQGRSLLNIILSSRAIDVPTAGRSHLEDIALLLRVSQPDVEHADEAEREQ